MNKKNQVKSRSPTVFRLETSVVVLNPPLQLKLGLKNQKNAKKNKDSTSDLMKLVQEAWKKRKTSDRMLDDRIRRLVEMETKNVASRAISKHDIDKEEKDSQEPFYKKRKTVDKDGNADIHKVEMKLNKKESQIQEKPKLPQSIPMKKLLKKTPKTNSNIATMGIEQGNKEILSDKSLMNQCDSVFSKTSQEGKTDLEETCRTGLTLETTCGMSSIMSTEAISDTDNGASHPSQKNSEDAKDINNPSFIECEAENALQEIISSKPLTEPQQSSNNPKLGKQIECKVETDATSIEKPSIVKENMKPFTIIRDPPRIRVKQKPNISIFSKKNQSTNNLVIPPTLNKPQIFPVSDPASVFNSMFNMPPIGLPPMQQGARFGINPDSTFPFPINMKDFVHPFKMKEVLFSRQSRPGHFLCGDKPQKITKLEICENQLLFTIEWKPLTNGSKVLNSILTRSEIMMHDPLFLLYYYEKYLNFEKSPDFSEANLKKLLTNIPSFDQTWMNLD